MLCVHTERLNVFMAGAETGCRVLNNVFRRAAHGNWRRDAEQRKNMMPPGKLALGLGDTG